jgi:alkanesulfonate monooxygenase SsuD/methylene tetrahydromethanopterin reductase-like flavin-dependent oxidoreductase (luciferase family)
VAIVGDESAVGEAIRQLGEAGASDFLAIPFPVDGDPSAVEHTRALLVRMARSG